MKKCVEKGSPIEIPGEIGESLFVVKKHGIASRCRVLGFGLGKKKIAIAKIGFPSKIKKGGSSTMIKSCIPGRESERG